MDNTKIQYRWPSINNVLNFSTVASLPKLLEKNPTVTVCEKLRGYSMCLSSKGWISSKSRVVADREKYKNLPLDSLRPVVKLVGAIGKELQSLLPDQDMQVLLYGDWIHSDSRYNYESRKLLPGQFFAFGLGIVPGHWDHELKPKLKQLFDWNLTFVSGSGLPYYLVNLNTGLIDFLTSRGVKTVFVYGDFSLQDAFAHPAICQDLSQSKVEGVILAWAEGNLKWLSRPLPNRDLSLVALEKTLAGNFTGIYKNLELVAFPFLGNQAKVGLLKEMYVAAKSKLLPFENFMPDVQDGNRVANVNHNKLICQMLDDCKERVCDIAYFVKIKEQKNYWIFVKFESAFAEHFPSWYE